MIAAPKAVRFDEDTLWVSMSGAAPEQHAKFI
jgi:hypothetical protein